MQDSPPATGRFSDIIPLRRSAILPGGFAEGCGRVGAIEEITVPELARKAQQELTVRCNAPAIGPAVQVKFADAGRPVKRLAVISGAGGSLFADALAMGAD